jgi:hypothetical protein
MISSDVSTSTQDHGRISCMRRPDASPAFVRRKTLHGFHPRQLPFTDRQRWSNRAPGTNPDATVPAWLRFLITPNREELSGLLPLPLINAEGVWSTNDDMGIHHHDLPSISEGDGGQWTSGCQEELPVGGANDWLMVLMQWTCVPCPPKLVLVDKSYRPCRDTE